MAEGASELLSISCPPPLSSPYFRSIGELTFLERLRSDLDVGAIKIKFAIVLRLLGLSASARDLLELASLARRFMRRDKATRGDRFFGNALFWILTGFSCFSPLFRANDSETTEKDDILSMFLWARDSHRATAFIYCEGRSEPSFLKFFSRSRLDRPRFPRERESQVSQVSPFDSITYDSKLESCLSRITRFTARECFLDFALLIEL